MCYPYKQYTTVNYAKGIISHQICLVRRINISEDEQQTYLQFQSRTLHFLRYLFYLISTCLLLIITPTSSLIAQINVITAVKTFFGGLEKDINSIASTTSSDAEFERIAILYFTNPIENDFTNSIPKNDNEAQLISGRDYLDQAKEFGCHYSFNPDITRLDYYYDKNLNRFIRVPVIISFANCPFSTPQGGKKFFDLALDSNGNILSILRAAFNEKSQHLTQGTLAPPPSPEVASYKPPSKPVPNNPAPVSPNTTSSPPCPNCEKCKNCTVEVNQVCNNLKSLGITRRKNESCEKALKRHIANLYTRVDCKQLGITLKEGEKCEDAIVRHYTDQVNCNRVAVLQIQQIGTETCASALDRYVKELEGRADCNKLLSLGIIPKEGEECEDVLRRYLTDGKDLSMDFKVKENYKDNTPNVIFSTVLLDKYGKDLGFPPRTKETYNTTPTIALDSVKVKDLITKLHEENLAQNYSIEEARPVNIEVYFFANEKAKDPKKRKKIILTSEGLTNKEYRQFRSSRVENIYVYMPIIPSLFPTNSQIPIKMMYGDIVVPETKEFESNPLIIDKFYSLFSVTGFKIPKNRIKEDNLPLFVSISYDKKNLIKNANATDKEKQRGFEFYINKGGKRRFNED